ncbi:MAG: class I SAM-dependent methyltransferase [Parasulfuritortus sp.]|jgi:SAM-dependent methyltransferase|nr:class I SAM-dependent methyltransferase [Parasulfuritortus sp.]
MTLNPQSLRTRLLDLASAPYRSVGPFAYRFARGKLGGDPVFFELLRRGLFPDRAHILDLGCGQGLLAAWLLAARQLHDSGEWPADWPTPARPASIRGVELLASDVKRAKAAQGAPATFECGDMRHTDFGQVDVVVILDVLHYIDIPAQDEVLRRVVAALPANGLFLTRVGDASAGLPFQLSNWVDRTVAFFRGNRLPPMHCRPLPDWIGKLEALGFSVETATMNGDLPFANVMLIARLGASPSGQ